MRALVTGGGGFLGGAIVDALLGQGAQVTSFGRGEYPELVARGVRVARGDVADAAAVIAAAEDQDVVFHCAALAGVWGPRAVFARTNVEGTRNVIEACRAAGVGRLIYTSTPSVCFDGTDHARASNDLPYAQRFLCAYAETKAAAERSVLEANSDALATCALRPHLIFGPGDPHLVPRLIERARAGKLAVVGDGRNEVSLTYIDNAAAAHLDAATGLEPGAPHAGRAYFLAQQEPVLLWEWIDELLAGVGLPPVRSRVSAPMAYAAGAAFELTWRLLGRRAEPPMTRFVARQLSTSHSYDMSPAHCDFGYRERVDLAQATALTLASLGTPAAVC